MYLHDIPLEKANDLFYQALHDAGLDHLLGTELIPLDEEAIGRILANSVVASRCSPHYHASAMDGFAVIAVETSLATLTRPVTLRLPEQAQYVDTGDPMPEGRNAVIPIENVESLLSDGSICSHEKASQPDMIRIRAGVTPWSHVRPMGEDIVISQLILAPGQKLRPADLGAAAAGGACDLIVAKKPIVGVIPTGTELVKIGVDAKCGELIEFNSVVLASQVIEWGGEPKRYPILSDDYAAICEQIKQAISECDLVLVNAGSSAGSEDYTARAVENLGELLVHGVAIRPGHPVILGMLPRPELDGETTKWVPVIGVPGYPVSAAITGEIIVKPLLEKWLGLPDYKEPNEIEAILTRKVASPAGDDDYLRVVLGYVEGRLLATPLSRGAGVITSLSKADGIVIIPRNVQGINSGEKVRVRLYKQEEELHRTILTIGSHDLSIDILAQFLSPYGKRLVSSNSGSLGGLMALQQHEAHFAGTHLLDVETGEYNLSYIRKYCPALPVHVFGWVERIQGILVPRGNPKKISGIKDLQREDVTFINRQRGSGTRNLLDYWIKQLSVNPNQIKGYEMEEYTHLAVATAVASGRADCGLAIEASAQILDLDFIPLFEETYQIVMPDTSLEDPLLKPVMDLMTDLRFKNAILALPGYKAGHLGDTVAVLP
ncbi:MAG: molybdopterin biosynthesis protein [Anaerolineaceae bacterium]